MGRGKHKTHKLPKQQLTVKVTQEVFDIIGFLNIKSGENMAEYLRRLINNDIDRFIYRLHR